MAYPDDNVVHDSFETNERTPLVPGLTDGRSQQTSTSRPLPHTRGPSLASIASSVKLPRAHKPHTVVNLLSAFLVIAASSSGLVTLASTRIFEDIFCHLYYAGRTGKLGQPIDESLCKEDDIQDKVAYLFAVGFSIDAIVNCSTALPWGAAADRFGRKTVLVFTTIGFLLQNVWIALVGWFADTIPPHFFWLSSLALICGGGNAAAGACIGSIITDILPELERSTAFMQIHVTSSLGNMVAPSLGSIMMTALGPWPVMFTGLSMQTASLLALFFVPETLHRKPAAGEESTTPSLKAQLICLGKQIRDMSSLLENPSVCLILGVFFCCAIPIMSTLQFLLQFVSKRYHIPIAQTGYVQTTFGIATIVVALVLAPWLSRFVVKPTTPRLLRIDDKHRRDLILTRWSYAITIIGALIAAISPGLGGFVAGLLVMACGSAGDSMVKSTASALVAPDQTSRLFTLIGSTTILSTLWGSPSLAVLFSAGMHKGGGWIGLPYYGVAIMTALMLLLMLLVRIPTQQHEQNDEELPSGEEESLVAET